ncbi:MAG: TolC family protein [Pseudomonadales bacterium]|nr:TolC family protein [Pseudomonadales bacterium]
MSWLRIVLAILGASFVADSFADPLVLGLPEAIEAALTNNVGYSVQRLTAAQAEAGQRAARGARWPSVDFTASATEYGYPTFVHGIRQPGVFPPLDDTINDLGLAFQLPLYAGGKLMNAIAIADLERNIAVERTRERAQELVFNVSAVYFKVQHLEALARSYRARIESLQSQQRRIALLRDVGRAAKLDQLRVSNLVSKAQYDLLQIENRGREARTALFQLMGGEQPPRNAVLVRYATTDGHLTDLDALREQASTRPDLRIAASQVESAAAREKQARAERLPSVSLVGGYRERSGDAWQFYDDWSVGLQARLPLFDGGVRRARIDQAVLAHRQAEKLVTGARQEAGKQIEDAWHARAEADARLRVSATSFAEATEVLAIEQLKLEQGVGVVTDVLSAETGVLASQADRLQAEFDRIVALFGMMRATGELEPSRVAELLVAKPKDLEESEAP